MKLFYRKYGTGRPLVILHGLLGSSANWHTLAKRFSRHFEVLLPDLRNHGASPHHEKMNYPVMARDLDEFFTEHRIASARLIGHSMGGKTAMEFALKYPEKVSRLVIADIAPRYYPVHHEHYIKILEEIDLDRYAGREEIDQTLSARIPNPAIRQFFLKNLKRSDSGKFDWKINLDVISRNLGNIGMEINSPTACQCPTLFVAGRLSDYILPADEADIRRLFTNSEIIYLEDAGHWVHADNPDEFYQLVYNFIDPD